MATTRKRLLSLVLAFVLAFSLLPISALAVGEGDIATQTTQQILNSGGTSYYKADGTAGSASDYDVSITKNLTATGTENLFDVEVKVTYKNTTTTTQSADAATSLIIDTSGSMRYCSECGDHDYYNNPTLKELDLCPDNSGRHYEDGWDWGDDCDNCGQSARNHLTAYYCPNCGKIVPGSRMLAAKEAACAFLDSYAASGKASGAARYISLVSFEEEATSYDLSQNSGTQYWVDVTNDTNLDYVKSVINNRLSAGGGTNTAGGVRLSDNLFSQGSANSTIQRIQNRYAVLLTDGEPTFGCNTNSTNVDTIDKNKGDGKNVSWQYTKDVETAANTMVNSHKVDLFAISYGLNGSIPNGKNQTVSITSWLQNDCYVGTRPADKGGASDVFMAGDSEALNSAFNSILTSIDHSGSEGEAVSDVISGGSVATQDKCIGFVKFLNANGATQNGDSVNWNLTHATADTNPPSGYTSYTMSYQVRLDNTQSGFVEGASYSAGAASFTFKDASTGQEYTKTSPAPTVKGYLGSLSFDKLSYHTVNGEREKLPGARFVLTSTNANPAITREAWSAADGENKGLVFFNETIPSGYTYTMTEAQAPSGYEPSDQEWTVTVAYGVVTVDPAVESDGVVNRQVQNYKDITISKTWYMPANPQGGETTKPIYVTLKQNGSDFATLYLNGSTATVNNCSDSSVTIAASQTTGTYWVYTVHVPDNNPETGGNYEYTIAEQAPEGFTPGGSGLSLTNTSTGKTTIYVEKEWILPEDAQITLPGTVQVEVLRNGHSFGDGGHTYLNVDSDSVTGNTVSSLELDAYDENGEYYTYKVTEVSNAAYQLVGITGSGSRSDPYVITNTVADEKIPVTVNKVWQDSGDDSLRPDSISAQLKQDGAEYGEAVELNESNGWSHTFTGLPKYSFLDAEGNETSDLSEVASVKVHTYTVAEVGDVEGYLSSASGLTLTNTRQEAGTVTVTKTWADGITSGHSGEVVVALSDNAGGSYENKTLNESNGWTASWEVQQYSASGEKLVFTVSEVSGPDNYEVSVSYGDNDETSAVFGTDGVANVTITNTPEGSDDTTAVTVNKTWIQPGDDHPSATFTLYQAKEGEEPVVYVYSDPSDGVNPAESVSDTYTFSNLPKYYFEQDPDTGDSIAVAYEYTVVESPVTLPNGDRYESQFTTEVGADGKLTYNFVNTITGTVSVTAEKEWIDLLSGDNSARTARATIQLERSTNGSSWTAVDGKYMTTNVDKSVTWSSLPKYDNGVLVQYRVTEQTVAGYTPQISGDLDDSANFSFKVTNKLSQDVTGSFTVTKNWVDGSAANGSRPAITLTLQQDGTDYGTATISNTGAVTSVTGELTAGQVSATVSDNNTWTIYFNNLERYEIGASSVKEYTYSVSESSVEGYESIVANDGASITNTLVQDYKSATVTKYWVDPTTDHPDVTFALTAKLADGTVVTEVNGAALPTAITLTQDEAKADGETVFLADGVGTDMWTYTVSGLPKYNDNRSEIFYTFSEPTAPDGYTAKALEVEGKVVPNTFVNTINQASVSVNGTKNWDRTVEGDYYLPGAVDSILVALYRDNNQLVPAEELAGGQNPMVVTKGENDTDEQWSFSFGELKKYDVDGDGHEYTYSVKEVYYEEVEGEQVLRQVENNGSIVYGSDTYDVTYSDGNVITNTYDQPQKYWYRVDTSYTTRQSGTTIFSYAVTGEMQEFAGPGTLSVDPETYAELNGIPFDYVAANTQAFIDARDGSDSPIEFTTENGVSITVDQINRVYVIHLEYVRDLYKLTTNYYYAGTSEEVYPTTVDPVQQTGTVTDIEDYEDPGKYTATESFTTERKAAPAGYEIVSVTLRNGSGEVVTVETKDGTLSFPDRGNFQGDDVTVTYYYDKISAEHQTIPDSVIFTKKGDSGETVGSAINDKITANAKFGLYNDAACKDENLVKELPMEANGTLTISAGSGLASDLAEGTYYLKEITAPTGYTIGEEKVYTVVVDEADTSHWDNNVWYPQTTWTITVDGSNVTSVDVLNNMMKATYSVEYYFETGVNTNTYEQNLEAYPNKTGLVITYFDTVSSSTYELGKDGMGVVPQGFSLNGTKTGPDTLTYAMVTGDPAQNVIRLYYDQDMTQREDLTITKNWIGEQKTATVALFETVDGVESISERADAVQTITQSYSWSGLDEYTADGKAITYAAYEVVDNNGTYVKVEDGSIITIDGIKYLVSYNDTIITNRELRDVTVTKTWSESTLDNEKCNVNVKLYAGSTLVTADAQGQAVGENGVITLTSSDGFTKTFSNLYATDEQGNRLTYSVKELGDDGVEVAAGSRVTLNGVNFTVSYAGTTVTNTKELGAIFVTKTFSGAPALSDDFQILVQNSDGPDAATVAILTLDGRNDTMAPTSGDGSAEHPYSWYIQDLPTANTYYAVESGEEIDNYTLQPGTVKSGTTTVDANKAIALNNIYQRNTVTMTITKDVTGALSEANFAKESFTFNVYDGQTLVGTVKLPKADNSTNPDDWKGEISVNTNTTYTVKEVGGAKGNYSLKVNGGTDSEESRTVTQAVALEDVSVAYTNEYTYVPNYTTITIDKVWADGDNRDGNRPDSITVSIKDRNGASIVNELVISENSVGEYTTDYRFDANYFTAPYVVTELGYTRDGAYTAVDAEGFEYTVSYQSGEGDNAKTDGTVVNGKVTITNSYEPETMVVPVVKSWSGVYAGQGVRSVTLELYANGQPTGLTLMLTADNSLEGDSSKWYGLFVSNYDAETDTGYTIYRNENGEPINYTVKEIKLGDHAMSGNTWGHWTVTTGTSTVEKVIPDVINSDWNLADDALALTVNNNYSVPDNPDPPVDPEDPPTEIPEDPTPGGDKPDVPEEPGETAPEEPTEIPEDPTPTGPAPQTGDVSGVWVALVTLSACGIAALTVFGKRKKEEDQ